MEILIVVAVVIIAYIAFSFYMMKGVEQITTKELKGLLQDKSNTYFFMDVRTPLEHKNNKIKKFKNIPLDTINSHLNRIPKDKKIVVICQSGSRSVVGAKALKKAGYKNVINVKGGMNAWRGGSN